MNKVVEMATKAKYVISREVGKLLNLTDIGKSDNFLDRIIKKTNSKIKKINQNAETVKIAYESTLEDMMDNIEDLKENIISAKYNIDPTRLKSNEAMDDFALEYLAGIAESKRNLTLAEERLESFIKANEDAVKETAKKLAIELAIISDINELVLANK